MSPGSGRQREVIVLETLEEKNMEIIRNVARKTALSFVEGFKEVGSVSKSWVCGGLCGGGCGAGCGGGCVAGCAADSPLIPVADVGSATGAGGAAGGAASGAAEGY